MKVADGPVHGLYLFLLFFCFLILFGLISILLHNVISTKIKQNSKIILIMNKN